MLWLTVEHFKAGDTFKNAFSKASKENKKFSFVISEKTLRKMSEFVLKWGINIYIWIYYSENWP